MPLFLRHSRLGSPFVALQWWHQLAPEVSHMTRCLVCLVLRTRQPLRVGRHLAGLLSFSAKRDCPPSEGPWTTLFQNRWKASASVTIRTKEPRPLKRYPLHHGRRLQGPAAVLRCYAVHPWFFVGVSSCLSPFGPLYLVSPSTPSPMCYPGLDRDSLRCSKRQQYPKVWHPDFAAAALTCCFAVASQQREAVGRIFRRRPFSRWQIELESKKRSSKNTQGSLKGGEGYFVCAMVAVLAAILERRYVKGLN